jgi:hypothetical protein
MNNSNVHSNIDSNIKNLNSYSNIKSHSSNINNTIHNTKLTVTNKRTPSYRG